MVGILIGKRLFLLFAVWFCCCVCARDDLYRILGVKRDATIQEIKRAYRRKALDTHPDKNPDSERAAEKFRKVVDAFEVLSNPETRRLYDRSGRTSQQRHANNNQPYQKSQWRKRTYRVDLKDSKRVKEARLRVMHVVSMAQLETVMLDNDGERLERSLLMCFYTPYTEKIAEESILFPYPFAGMSAQNIWWEDILQTVIVRYHKSNDVSRFFDIPTVDTAPVFVFVRKGSTLKQHSDVLVTDNRAEFEEWVWKQLQVEVTFVNRHDHPVELYWVHEDRATLRSTISPGGSHGETTMLSHQYVARDARVDAFADSPGRYKLTPNVLLESWKITSVESPQTLYIHTRPCVDLSGHCEFWSVTPKGECDRNPTFMHDKCPLTCKVCSENGTSSIKDEL